MLAFVRVFKKGDHIHHYLLMIVMAFNATFNNISVMSRQSVLFLVPRVPGENHRPAASMSE
jgi:hypothetical protein